MAQSQPQLQGKTNQISTPNILTETTLDQGDIEVEIDLEIAAEIMEDWDQSKVMFEDYKKSQDSLCITKTNPALQELEILIFPLLRDFLYKLLHRTMQEDCCYKPRSSFNGIDYLSESFYNANSKYPHRMNPCLHIFEMDWVNLELKKRPRPFYPLSSLMTRETAVRYIQAYLRGYWIRKRPEFNEIRTFWKPLPWGAINSQLHYRGEQAIANHTTLESKQQPTTLP
ncbi:IQ domain-containing protein K-like isoform X2 [Diabrotica undecimpunctata]|uniref:IQ domain-containing protein K-like isoform X2 n=1 Tax=Diabrotica undecimpunctata TaxID=50387 RepID=UPI003B64179A